MVWYKVYAKAVAATFSALGVAVTLTVDNGVSLNDGLAIALAGVGALAVGMVPNQEQR